MKILRSRVCTEPRVSHAVKMTVDFVPRGTVISECFKKAGNERNERARESLNGNQCENDYAQWPGGERAGNFARAGSLIYADARFRMAILRRGRERARRSPRPREEDNHAVWLFMTPRFDLSSRHLCSS